MGKNSLPLERTLQLVIQYQRSALKSYTYDSDYYNFKITLTYLSLKVKQNNHYLFFLPDIVYI